MENELIGLMESRNYKKLRTIIDDMNESDLAEIISDWEIKDLSKIFRLISKDKAADVFAELDITTATELLNYLTDKEAVSLIEDMAADDATDILEEMPANIVDKLLKMCSPSTRKDINKLLKYEEDSAGSIMTVEYSELKGKYTIEEAIKSLKKDKDEYETLENCYVVDNKRKLVGYVSLKDLLFADKKLCINDIVNDDLIFVHTNTDQEEVASIFQKYNLNIMPVVDSEERLVGIITIDDVIEVIESEATEDMEKMAAIIPNDKHYDKMGAFEIFKARIPWLLLLMISATFTGKIIQSFEDELAACTILTAFIPMLMDTGGNAGGQSSVSIIRALSLNDIEFKDIFKVIFKEFRVALFCSVALCICNFLKLLVIDHVSTIVASVVCLTMVVTVIIAKFIGSILPMIAKRVGFDPAVMASPFITTIVDACSLFVYFLIARLLLGI